MKESDAVLPKGTLVKIDGIPYEPLGNVKAEGSKLRDTGKGVYSRKHSLPKVVS